MKRFLIVFCMFLACSFISQAKNYVVCIGIADYPDIDMDLKLSETDAITMKGLYEKNGDSEIVVFTNENARVSTVTSALNDLFAKASSDDAIIFFFSGHGVPGCFVCYDGVLKYDTLTNIMSKSGANSKMIFADACFSGKARKEGKGERVVEVRWGVLDEKVTCTNRRKCCLFSGVTWLGHKGFVRGWQEIWLEK